MVTCLYTRPLARQGAHMTTAPAPEILDILSADFSANPYLAYRVMRDEYPLFRHEATQSYVVSRHDDVTLAFRDRRFTTANYGWQLEPVHGRTILQLSGRDHAVRRQLVTP